MRKDILCSDGGTLERTAGGSARSETSKKIEMELIKDAELIHAALMDGVTIGYLAEFFEVCHVRLRNFIEINNLKLPKGTDTFSRIGIHQLSKEVRLGFINLDEPYVITYSNEVKGVFITLEMWEKIKEFPDESG